MVIHHELAMHPGRETLVAAAGTGELALGIGEELPCSASWISW
jgi:hypothetical protein